MNYINVRELLRDYDKAIESLPLTVTKFGKPIFEIWPVGQLSDKGTVVFNSEPVDMKYLSTHTAPAREPEPMVVPTAFVKCAYPICKHVASAVGKIYDEGEWKDANMCKEHAAKSLKEFAKI